MTIGTALVFDTETSGVPIFRDKDGNSVAADAPGQPRLLSIAAALITDMGAELERMHQFILHPDHTVDEEGEAFRINGITQAFLEENGRGVREVLDEYDAMVDRCDYITAFSIGFDQKMVRSEQRRAKRDDRYGYRPTFELMYKARSLACEKMNGPHTNPKKLGECFHNITGMELVDAHDAEADMEGKIEILRQLLIYGMVEPKEQVSKR